MTLDIWPRLRESPADNAVVVTSNTVGLFRLASNDSEWNVNEATVYGITFAAVEAI
jgi:intracellular sulfur oxidation DsrE/DsrF family protein